jgi:hypothetical protein
MHAIRLLEIDATPRHLPCEVEKLMAPWLAFDPAHFDMKAGELYDADFPEAHSSYYIAVRSTGEVSAEQASRFLRSVIGAAGSLRLPIIEIEYEHPEYQNLIHEFGW